MSKSFSKPFYNSKAWKQIRKYIIQLQYNICGICNERPIEEVHHKIVLNENNIHDADVTLNPENLIGLCFACHKKVHEEDTIKRSSSTKNGLHFDNNGDLIQHTVTPR